MHLQRYFDYPVQLTSSHQPLVDHPADSAPAPRCMDLVWQALHGAQGMARQVLRYLDCRPGLPSDTLEAPAAAHQPAPMMSLASAERAAEEPPQSAPALPVGPAPLKSVLLPPDHARRTRPVRFAENLPTYKTPARATTESTSESDSDDEDSVHSMPMLLRDAACLDFSLLKAPTHDTATAGFQQAVRKPVLNLQSSVELWSNPRLKLDQRLDLLQGSRVQLQELSTLVSDFKSSLNNDPKAKAHSTEIIQALFNKLIVLGWEIRHTDELIAQCEEALEPENALDLNGISRFARGDTEVIVRSMHDPLLKLATKYNDLEETATNSPPGTFDWQLAAKGIVSSLKRMEDLLMDHVLAYRGRDRGFVQWISNKTTALQQERLCWENKLRRYSF